MKKLVMLAFGIALMMSVTAFSQDTVKHENMKSDDAKAEKMSKRAVSDKDGKTWKVSNPDALKGHEGHHVSGAGARGRGQRQDSCHIP